VLCTFFRHNSFVQISFVVIVYVVVFLPFHFHLHFIKVAIHLGDFLKFRPEQSKP
jgi:hypothetical protein